MEEEVPGPAKTTKRTYSHEQLDELERECFGGTMKNADIAAAITRLNGAREVTTLDVRSFVEGQFKEAEEGRCVKR